MSTTESFNRARVLAIAFGLAVLVTLYVLLEPHNASMAKGLLQGGAVALILLAIAFWRAARGHATGSAERTMTGIGDERDDRIAGDALAYGGLLSFFWMTGCAIAIAMGAPPEIPLAVMLWAQLATVVIAYQVVLRQT